MIECSTVSECFPELSLEERLHNAEFRLRMTAYNKATGKDNVYIGQYEVLEESLRREAESLGLDPEVQIARFNEFVLLFTLQT